MYVCMYVCMHVCIYMPIAALPPSLPLTESLPHHLWEGRCLPGYPPTLVHQVSAGLGTSSPTKARQGSPLLHVCCRPLSSSYMLFDWCLSLWEPQEVQASWFCWSSCGVPIPFRTFNPSPNSSVRISELHPIFGCGYLYLFQAAAGWSLSELC